MANGLFGGGDGTELSPYLVEDAQDLWAVRGNPSAHYKQIYNIDLNVFNEDGGWIPIGTLEAPFTGSYDGNEFEIKNLWVAGKAYSSLVGYVSNAKFKNILLLNVLIVSATTDGIGGLAGVAENMAEDSIYNCHVRGIINELAKSGKKIGGVVGECSSVASAINKCSFAGNIYGSGVSDYIGGIAGNCNTSIRNCFTTGKLISQASGTQQPTNIAGLTGNLGVDRECVYCYSTMDIDALKARYVAGLIGIISKGSSVLKSWARGNIKGKSNVGGLVGYQGQSDAQINSCYSAGKVEASGSYNGGLVGSATNTGNIINSVWDIEASGQATSAGGIGKTTAEMKDMQTYIDLGWSI